MGRNPLATPIIQFAVALAGIAAIVAIALTSSARGQEVPATVVATILCRDEASGKALASVVRAAPSGEVPGCSGAMIRGAFPVLRVVQWFDADWEGDPFALVEVPAGFTVAWPGINAAGLTYPGRGV